MNMIELSFVDTAIGLIPLLFGIIVFYQVLGKSRELVLASARMVLQLIGIGFALTFIFQYSMPLLGLAILLIMIIAASAISVRPIHRPKQHNLIAATCAITVGGGLNLAWILLAVLRLDPWYQPQLVIPLAGMVFANGMNAISVAAERYQQEQKSAEENKSDVNKAKKQAFQAAMIPQINTLLAVGLVSLPGMMTGQILSGVSPIIAVRYQVIIMSMIASTSIICIWAYFYILQMLKPAQKAA